MALTGKTIGQLTYLSGVTTDTPTNTVTPT